MAIFFNEYCRRRFGCKVYKLSLDGGFTCPNRDGTKRDLIAPLWSADKKRVLNYLHKTLKNLP